jgi:hypothetical protein
LIALSQNKNDSIRDPEVNALVLDHIAYPSLKDCYRYLQSILRVYRDAQGSLFMPELAPFLFEEDGEYTNYHFVIDELITLVETTSGRLLIDRQYERLWEQHFPKAIDLLRGLQFLEDYVLLHLLGCYETGQGRFRWEVRALMGADLDKPTTHLFRGYPQKEFQLALGRFDEGREDILYLCPFVIFEECLECRRRGLLPPRELFLYERLDENNIVYVGLRESYGTEHRRVLSEPFRSLSNWLKSLGYPELPDREPVSEERPRSRAIARSEVSRRSRRWTEGQLQRFGKKYDGELYLEREFVEDHLQYFLQAAESGFLVVGNSGTGKTNLLCHMAERQMQQHPEKIVLLYNCADFHNRLDLTTIITNHLGVDLTFAQLLAQLDEQLREVNSHFLLLLDAFNEHDQPEELLRTVNDDLILPFKYSWLKVVASCRSESWEQLRLMDIPSPNLYYHPDGELSARLTRFTEIELPEVYGLYQHSPKYNLQTDFQALSPQTQRLIEDPLMLRLVAEGYAGRAVPPDVGSRQVFERYVQEKIGSERGGEAYRSYQQEKRIVDRLMSLMREARQDYLDVGSLGQDSQIGQWVLNRKKGSPYMELLDKGVLMEFATEGTATFSIFTQRERKVKFTYDRLFEFLLAEQVLPAKPTQEELISLLQESREYPSLWGAVKVGLIMMAATGQEKSLLEMAQLDAPEVRGMVIEVLTTMGGEKPSEVEVWLKRLLTSGNEAAKLVAILTGYNLSMMGILGLALEDRNDTTRSTAAQYAYYLWERNNAEGERLIQGISEKMGVRNINALRSFIEISTYMSTHLLTEPEITYPFVRMWGNFFQKFPLTSPSKGVALDKVKRALRGKIIEIGAGWIGDGFRSGDVHNYDSLSSFFTLPKEQRQRLARFAIYMDPDMADIEDIEDELFALAQISEAVFAFVLSGILISHSIPRPDRVLKTVARLFEEGNTMSKFTAKAVLATALIPMAAQGLSRPVEHQYLAKLREYVLRMWTDPNSIICLAGQKYGVGCSHIDFPIWLDLMMQPGDVTFIDRLIETPLAVPLCFRQSLDPDPELRSIVTIIDSLGTIGARRRLPIPSLRTMKRWFNYDSPYVCNALGKALARIRNAYPVEVDNYLFSRSVGRSIPATILTAMKQYSRIESGSEVLFASGQLSAQSFLYMPGGPKEVAQAVQSMLSSNDLPSMLRIVVERIIEVAQGIMVS